MVLLMGNSLGLGTLVGATPLYFEGKFASSVFLPIRSLYGDMTNNKEAEMSYNQYGVSSVPNVALTTNVPWSDHLGTQADVTLDSGDAAIFVPEATLTVPANTIESGSWLRVAIRWDLLTAADGGKSGASINLYLGDILLSTWSDMADPNSGRRNSMVDVNFHGSDDSALYTYRTDISYCQGRIQGGVPQDATILESGPNWSTTFDATAANSLGLRGFDSGGTAEIRFFDICAWVMPPVSAK